MADVNIPPRLLQALNSLNQIGAAINQGDHGDRPGFQTTLRLIVESAIKVVPGASAVIYSFDPGRQVFDPDSRVSAGELSAPTPGDEPRPDGMGMQAIGRRRRILSYQETETTIHHIKVAAGAQVVACFPLVVVREPLGALYVYLHDKRHFSQLELLMLDNFVNLAAMALYQARQMALVRQDLARAEEELARLRRADLLISSRLGLEETLEAILEMALEVTEARYGIFRLVDGSSGKLVTAAIAGDDLGRPAVEALPVNTTSIMGWVAKHRQAVCIADLRANPWCRIYYPLDHELEMRSELAVPLIGASGRLEGVINLESPLVGAFSEQDSHLLQALATQAVIAIQEVRLLDALQEIAQRLLTETPQAVLNRLVELACELLNAMAGSIWVLREDELELWASNNGMDRLGDRISVTGSLAGQAMDSRSLVITGNWQDEPGDPQRQSAQPQDWKGALIAPLLAGDGSQALGAFSVVGGTEGPRRFAQSEWDKKVLSVLARHAALAVQEAARQEALRAAQEQRAVAETFAVVGDIAANLLHRVNNKVGTIPVRVEGIRYKSLAALQDDSYLAANLEEIERSASEAMQAMRESLFHLRPIEVMPVDVASCVTQALRASEMPPSVQVKLKGLEPLPAVAAGPSRLTLVFANLLENAASAMEGEGMITIEGALLAARPGSHHGAQDRVEIRVTDNGPGIEPAYHQRIFEFNFSASKDHAGKLGFGLWWVKTLMVRFGGSIAVESDGRHGTTFKLQLPVANRS